MIKILIADDHPLFREGMKKIIKEEPDMKIVAETESPPEVLELINTSKPDLLMLDISLPGRSGIDITKDVRSFHPKLPIIIISMHAEERFAVRALKAGASAYLNKECDAKVVLEAVRVVVTGKKYITPKVAEQLAHDVDSSASKLTHELLSDREFEVMQLIASGKTIRDIAEQLSLSINTINTYRMRIFEKMNLKTNIDLVHYSIQHGLID